ncbi:MAG: sulfite exporter TauE/SafE family protein [Bacteroidales bacterium]|nr:sulfite exporter TauE/SafE family protein [Bacteroidales bacterium]
MELISLYNLSISQWVLVVLCGMIIGMSKTGISGAGLVVVPVLAGIFGGRPSVGLLLPMLVVADIFAVSFYNRHAEWKYVFKLLPPAFLGILLALFTGKWVNDEQFRELIGIVVIAGIGLLIYRDLRDKNKEIPSAWWFSALLGFGGGFATMIGNAAGPIMAFYLLSMRLPKNIYIGTGAWFFFIVNVLKIPLHIFVWKTITSQSIMFDIILIPAIIAGAFAGFYLVKLIPEKIFRIFIILTTLISAIALFK